MSQIKQDQYILGQSQTGTISSTISNVQLNLALKTSNLSINGGNISGIVTTNGSPISNAYVKLMSTDYKPIMHAVTNAEGIYSLINITPGSYTIFAVAKNMKLLEKSPIDIEEYINYTINFSLTQSPTSLLWVVAGDLTNSSTNNPINGAIVSLFINYPNQDKILTAVTYSNSYGQYAFRSIPTGNYSLKVSALGYQATSTNISLSSEGGIKNINIALEASLQNNSNGTISGIITDKSTNIPVPNADVILYSQNPDGTLNPIAFTNANSDGVYLFGNVAPGDYKVKSNILEPATVTSAVVIPNSPNFINFKILGPINPNQNLGKKMLVNKTFEPNEVKLISPVTINNNLIVGLQYKKGGINFSIHAPESGRYSLLIKYVTNSNNQIANININGSKLKDTLHFNKTKSMNLIDSETLDLFLVLTKGTNEIQIYNS